MYAAYKQPVLGCRLHYRKAVSQPPQGMIRSAIGGVTGDDNPRPAAGGNGALPFW